MSIISPFPQSTVISLYKGIPWDNSYKDIRLFNSATERNTFLGTKLANSWANCSIVKNGSTILLTGQFNDYITCNYMSFTNGTFSNEKTFYCFVKSVNYKNNNTFEVEYEIDWIQSYLFDFVIGECFVEREHVNSDAIGEHTLPEDIDPGEMVVSDYTMWLEEPGVLLQFIPETTEPTVSNISGVVDGSITQAYPLGAIGVLSDTISAFNDTPERVVQLTMITESMGTPGYSAQKFSKNVSFDRPSLSFKFQSDTYVPRNNKLAIYPYCCFTVDNFSGDLETFRYEDFLSPTGTFQFTIDGMPIPKPTMQCYPHSYKNNGLAPQFAVVYDDFPQCAWISDTFKRWLTETKYTRASQLANMITGLAPVAIGSNDSAIQGATEFFGEVAGYQQTMYNHKLHGYALNGTIGISGLNFARGWIGFRVTQFTCKPEIARIIDRRLTRYGYRVDTPKKPNIRGRQYINYVKCRGAMVDGDIAVDAKNALENALNSGVTFWHTNNMDMTITNNPISGG